MVVHTKLRRYAKMAATFCLNLAFGASQALDLRKDFSVAQFKVAGLSKFENVELDELQSLIDAKPAAAEDSPNSSMTASRPALAVTQKSPDWHPALLESKRKVVQTEAADTFKGLFGANKARLVNGQVWQPTDQAIFSRKLRDRRVRLNPAIIERWRRQFVDNNLSFTVERAQ